jgi:hypothetical protein
MATLWTGGLQPICVDRVVAGIDLCLGLVRTYGPQDNQERAKEDELYGP